MMKSRRKTQFAAPTRITAAALLTAAAAACSAAATVEAEFVCRVEVQGRPELSCSYLECVPIFVPVSGRLEVSAADKRRMVEVTANWKKDGGGITHLAGCDYRLTAPPRQGAYTMYLTLGPEDPAPASMALLVVEAVEQPSDWSIRLDGVTEKYLDPAGAGSKRVRKHTARYLPPLLFLPWEKWKDVEICPGVKTEMFLPRNRLGKRAARSFPVSPPLLNKLAMGMSLLEERGLDPSALKAISSFRPPSYNRGVSGAAGYSRHQYGDGIDLIYDADGNGKMDDITGDGRANRRDGIVLGDIFRKTEQLGAVAGGIGVYEYPSKKSRFAHVHVDARGFVTRWGTTYYRRPAGRFRWWPKDEYRENDGDDD